MLIQQQNNIAMYFLPLIFYSNSKTLNIHGMIFQELIQAMFLTPCFLVSSWISKQNFQPKWTGNILLWFGTDKIFFSSVHVQYRYAYSVVTLSITLI